MSEAGPIYSEAWRVPVLEEEIKKLTAVYEGTIGNLEQALDNADGEIAGLKRRIKELEAEGKEG